MRSAVVKVLAGLLMILSLNLLMGCEEDIPDYAADVIGAYIVESGVIDGVSYTRSGQSLEDALLVEITREDISSLVNDDTHCEATYDTETDYIEGVTETAILLTDGSSIDYEFAAGELTLHQAGDILVLQPYADTFPPEMWTDPELLPNDTYEPDDDPSLATVIAAGGTIQNHYMADCDEVDYFMFTAIADTSYSLRTTTPLGSELDLTLALYNGAGDLMDENDDLAYPDLNPGLDWTCPTTGDYYIKIGNLWGDQHGDYSIFVTVFYGLLKAPLATLVKTPKVRPELSFGD